MTRKEVVKKLKLLDKYLDKWYWLSDNTKDPKVKKFANEQIKKILDKQWKIIGSNERNYNK